MSASRTLVTILLCGAAPGIGAEDTTPAPIHARAATGSAAAAGIGLPSDTEIRKLLAERVDALAGTEDGIGICVGIIEPRGRRVVSYGHLARGDPRPLDGDTEFEIASVTKAFTALLLSDMVLRGEVALADPVAKYLPAGVRIPERKGRSITLLDLATHTSGLPFMPDDLPAFDDPGAATYGSAQLHQFLARYTLPRDIGATWDYSNLGYWLLGQALALRAGTDYETLLKVRVLAPLGLKSTGATLSPEMQAKLAPGHDAALRPAPAISTIPVYSAMADVLNLYSTTNDLLTLLSVAMGYERSPLAPAMDAMLGTRRAKTPAGEFQALGWVVIAAGEEPLIYHDGGSLGFASSVTWDPGRRVGVVVLSNQVAGVSDIARHLLRPDLPLEKPTTRRAEIPLATAVLDTYVGRYEAPGEGLFRFVREGDFLMIQLPADWGLPRMHLRPETPRDFFTSELPLRVTFQTGADGRVSGVLIHPPRGQAAILAKRIDSDH